MRIADLRSYSFGLFVAMFVLVCEPSANSQTYKSFDPPGSVQTSAHGINALGEIAGTYTDGNGRYHGFIRYRNGYIITFEAPGSGSGRSQGTSALAISPLGEVTGLYEDAKNICHGFIRSSGGAITTFDVPGLGHLQLAFAGTKPQSINVQGTITGFYQGDDAVNHVFVRTRDGRLTTVVIEGACTTCSNQGAFAQSINSSGVIVGSYVDDFGLTHGFLRAGDGTVTSFDAPGAGAGISPGTYPSSINESGFVTGYFQDANSAYHGFVRSQDGTSVNFEAPAADLDATLGTLAVSINSSGAVTGFFESGSPNYLTHGFIRTPDGTLTTLDVPCAGIELGQGTTPTSINAFGSVVGFYLDANNVEHGFLFSKD